MSHKCSICGINDVDNEGDICESCALNQDPYASPNSVITKHTRAIPVGQNSTPSAGGNSHGRKVLINGPANGNMPIAQQPSVPQNNTSKRVVASPQPIVKKPPQQNEEPTQKYIIKGIVKNLKTDESANSSKIGKILRAMFTGTPYSKYDDITSFQVFPDYTGTSINSNGYYCDQVLVYGRIISGQICDNNEVEVYGHRDSNNTIIAKSITNTATGATITAQKSISGLALWVIFLCIVAIAVTIIYLIVSSVVPTVTNVVSTQIMPYSGLIIAGLIIVFILFIVIYIKYKIRCRRRNQYLKHKYMRR